MTVFAPRISVQTSSIPLITLRELVKSQFPTLITLLFGKVTFPNKRVVKVGNWDLTSSRRVIKEIDDVWTEILGANELVSHLQYQYYTTVKTTSESEESIPLEDLDTE